MRFDIAQLNQHQHAHFQKLFLLRNSDINPIIVFPEIAFEDLRRIVEYIYIGELTIDEESLDGFMFAAELFQIKGVLVGTPFQAQISNQRNSIESDDSTSSNDSTSCSPSSDDSNERNLSPAPTTKIRKKIPPAKRPVTTQKARKLPQKLPKANTTDDPEIFQCSYCLKFFKNARIQKQHFQSHCILNPNRKTFQCSTCSRIFQRKCRLTAHEKLHKVVDDK